MPVVTIAENGSQLMKAVKKDESEIVDVICESMKRMPIRQKMERKAVEEMVARLFDETKEPLVFKAIADDKIQGVIGCEVTEDAECEINFINAREEKKGFGTALEKLMRDEAKKLGAKKMVIRNREYSWIFFNKRGYEEFDMAGNYIRSLDLTK